MKYWLSSEEETRKAGAALAGVLLPLVDSGPVVVFIRGNLGAGKSTFVRGFLSRAGVTGVMPSPTYSLVEPYQTDSLNVYHMDAYRIADGAELDYLGLDDVDQPGSMLLVEWPDHVSDDLPLPTATVDLEMSANPMRSAKRSAEGSSTCDTSASHGPADTGSGSSETHIEESVKVLDHDRAVDRYAPAGSSDSGKEWQDAAQVGRLLHIQLGAVPVQVEQRLSASTDWQGLVQVVT